MLIESTGVTDEHKVVRDDIEVKYLPAMETAAKLGNMRNANLVMLGAYIGITKLLMRQSVLEEIERRFGGRGGAEAASASKDAFLAGVKLAADLSSAA